MIDIPLGKALIVAAVREPGRVGCNVCFFWEKCSEEWLELACNEDERKDGKNVYFKLLDYPSSELRIDGMLAGSKVTSGE
jgi:hypothetical protein